jgi:hypothetical protein
MRKEEIPQKRREEFGDSNVLMDQGGAIRLKGSQDRLTSDSFGGCSAISAESNSLYGLYHLRSTLEERGIDEETPVSEYIEYNGIRIKGDSVLKPYIDWVKRLGEVAQGERIHFKIGTPNSYVSDKVQENHPYIGMERFLRSICKSCGIENYDIELVNMKDVTHVSLTSNGLTCYGYTKEEIEVQKAQYQTDEEILEHALTSDQQRLNFVIGDPNIDLDHSLQDKYQERILHQKMVEAKRALELMKKQDDQQKLVERQKLLDDLNGQKNELVARLEVLVAQSLSQLDKSPKGSNPIHNKYLFLVELLDVAKSDDLSSIDKMREFQCFKGLTETTPSKFSTFLSKKPIEPQRTEIGIIYDQMVCLKDKFKTVPEEPSNGVTVVLN